MWLITMLLLCQFSRQVARKKVKARGNDKVVVGDYYKISPVCTSDIVDYDTRMHLLAFFGREVLCHRSFRLVEPDALQSCIFLV